MELRCHECPAAAKWGGTELLCFGYAFTRPPTYGKPLPCNKMGKCVLGNKRVDELIGYYRDMEECRERGEEVEGKCRARKKLEEVFAD